LILEWPPCDHGISTGCGSGIAADPKPVPSWPLTLLPQQAAVVLAKIAHVWRPIAVLVGATQERNAPRRTAAAGGLARDVEQDDSRPE
jgi:hypothetical protein